MLTGELWEPARIGAVLGWLRNPKPKLEAACPLGPAPPSKLGRLTPASGKADKTIGRREPQVFLLTFLPAPPTQLSPLPPSPPPQAVAMVPGILFVSRALGFGMLRSHCPLEGARMPWKGYITSLRPWNKLDCGILSCWNKTCCGGKILEERKRK